MTQLKIDARFKKKLVARYSKYTAEAGVLEDKPYRLPRPASQGKGTLAGGPVRKMKNKTSGTVQEVAERIRKDLKIPYLTAPVEKPNSKDMKNFVAVFMQYTVGAFRSPSQVETALRAVIRNPIHAKKYGRNTRARAKVKTFNRKLFDTGQFFKAIRAKVRRTRVQK